VGRPLAGPPAATTHRPVTGRVPGLAGEPPGADNRRSLIHRPKRYLGAARPVVMLRVVSRLVRPESLVVIEIVAAKACN